MKDTCRSSYYYCTPVTAPSVQADHWKEFLEPELEAAGYQGVYKQKTRESMGQVIDYIQGDRIGYI